MSKSETWSFTQPKNKKSWKFPNSQHFLNSVYYSVLQNTLMWFLDHVSDAWNRKFPSDSRNSRAFIWQRWRVLLLQPVCSVLTFGLGCVPGPTSRWANGDQEVAQTEPPQESPAWNLPDTPAVHQGNQEQEPAYVVSTTDRLQLQLNNCVIFLFHVFMAHISLRSRLEIPLSHETISLCVSCLFLFLFLHRELFRSSWMTSFRPSLASLRTAPLWQSNISSTSWKSRLTNGASQTQTPCTSGKPTGRQLNSVIKVPFGHLAVQVQGLKSLSSPLCAVYLCVSGWTSWRILSLCLTSIRRITWTPACLSSPRLL